MIRAAFSMTRGGTAASTSPIRFARRASTDRPVIIRSSAALGPTTFGSRFTPPQPGRMPSITSGSANRVPGSSTAMR